MIKQSSTRTKKREKQKAEDFIQKLYDSIGNKDEQEEEE